MSLKPIHCEVYQRDAETLGGAAIVVEVRQSAIPLSYEFLLPIDAAVFILRLNNGKIDASGLSSRIPLISKEPGQ